MPAYFDASEFIKQKHSRITILKEVEPAVSTRINKHTGKEKVHKTRRYLCRCDCGKIWEVNLNNIKSGKTKSCGCFRNDNTRSMSLKHGYASNLRKRSAEYAIWATMLQRCNNPKAGKYRFYGGKGITVCERWKQFENFIADMGDRPSEDYSLDRINPFGNYEPDNCRWTTQVVQHNNVRNANPIEYSGVVANTRQWSELTGINESTLKNRRKYKWPAEAMLTTPARKMKSTKQSD